MSTSALVHRSCEQCGGAFRARRTQVRIGRGRFCSKSCAGRANMLARRRAGFSPVRQPSPDWHARFWPKVDTSGSCWLWCGAVNGAGYGVFYVPGRVRQRSHRVAYELLHGPIPAGAILRHTCEDRYPPGDLTYRRCVLHCIPGTYAENTADMIASGRAPWLLSAAEENRALTAIVRQAARDAAVLRFGEAWGSSHKVKAPRCSVLYECDSEGHPIVAEVPA